jgi:hypothetical protein
MKKIAVLVVAVIGLAACRSGVALAQTLSYYLDAPQYQITKDSKGFDKIEMTEFRADGIPGNPILPLKTINVLVHPDVILPTIKLTVVAEESEILEGTYKIRPAAPDTTRIDDVYVQDWGGTVNIADGKNMDVFGEDAFFPSESVRAEPFSQLRQWKFIRVVFQPFQYNPVTGKLKRINWVQFNITYDRSSDQTGAVKMADSAGTSGLAPSIFYNYNELKSAYTSGKMADQAGATTYDYVIITTNATVAGSTKLADFIAHKESRGHSVLVVTEDDFDGLTGQAPNHRAEKIRQWLIDNYVGYGIEYVLLIGNPAPFETLNGDIPMKMCWPRGATGMDVQAPTDMFYADLSGNWDWDGDGKFGEWPDDLAVGGFDFSAEVYVGRIPLYDADYTALDSILQKMIDYETSVNGSWRNHILLPMSFSEPGYDGAVLAEQMKDDFLNSRGWSSWTMYQQGSGGCSAADSIYESDQDLWGHVYYSGHTNLSYRWSTSPAGIVCWWGHGNIDAAYIGYDGCWDNYLFCNDFLPKLDDSKPAFTFQISCDNGYPEFSDNLGYMLLKRGAVATVSASRLSWYSSSEGYGDFDGSSTNAGMGYEYVNRVTQQMEAGKALAQTWLAVQPITANTRLMNLFAFNLYGDPAMNNNGITNTPPVADSQSVSTTEVTPKEIILTGSDVEGDPLTFKVTVGPRRGYLMVNTPPYVTYKPYTNTVGADSFTFKVNDGYSDSNPATVSVTVAGKYLNILKDGSGSGTVTSAPTGIDCGVGCSGNYRRNSAVRLTATPDAGSALKSWNYPGCPGNGDCVVTMDADKTITATFEPDVDTDGISTSVENAGPNSGDGNRDGTPDSQQSLVATFPDTNGNYVTLVGNGGTTLDRVAADGNPSSGDAPAGASFPCGFLDFRLAGVTPGGSATVTVILHQKADINSYYKYGPEPGNPTPHWYKFMYNQSTGAQIFQETNQTRIVLNFVDGGRGDDDLTANGVIDDIGAPANATSSGSGGGGGGGGGCYIESLFN